MHELTLEGCKSEWGLEILHFFPRINLLNINTLILYMFRGFFVEFHKVQLTRGSHAAAFGACLPSIILLPACECLVSAEHVMRTT